MEQWINILSTKGKSAYSSAKKARLMDSSLQDTETVRIFNESELKEFAWEWFKKESENLHKMLDVKLDKDCEKRLRIRFEQLWKENENG
jgi:hypothetical protein